MITRLFIPEKIQDYYVLGKRIIGFDIGKTHISATRSYVHGRSISIEKSLSVELTTGTQLDYHERATKAIQEILSQLGNGHTIVSSLSNSVVFFKELTLPFTEQEKIAQVLAYEIEPLLPFSLDQAVYDFIITQTGVEQATVLVAVVLKTVIAEHVVLFEAAGAYPDQITVDLFSLYKLYRAIPAYKNLTGLVIIVDTSFSSTTIAMVYNGVLTYVRVMPQGLTSLVQHIHEGGQITLNEAAVSAFVDTIDMTITGFKQRGQTDTSIHILALGPGSEVPAFVDALTRTFEHVQVVQEQALVQSGIVCASHVTCAQLISVGASLPEDNPCNLLPEVNTRIDTIVSKQLITAGILAVCILVGLIGSTYWKIHRLNSVFKKSERELLATLDTTLGVSEKKVADGLEQARRKVEDQDRIWFSFSSQTRSSFLTYLQKISTKINKRELGLTAKKLTMSHDLISLEGRVKDIQALVLLEEALKATNLGIVSIPQEPIFVITITLAKKRNEER